MTFGKFSDPNFGQLRKGSFILHEQLFRVGLALHCNFLVNSVFSVGMDFSLHFVFYLILYISALVANKRVHYYAGCVNKRIISNTPTHGHFVNICTLNTDSRGIG